MFLISLLLIGLVAIALKNERVLFSAERTELVTIRVAGDC